MFEEYKIMLGKKIEFAMQMQQINNINPFFVQPREGFFNSNWLNCTVLKFEQARIGIDQ